VSVDLRLGCCLSVMRGLPVGSIDAVVTDPPAGIAFMGKEWDGSRGGRDAWVAWLSERMAEALRVAKPGAHALVWALPRTSHWTAWALESAGWTIEDRIAHHFGQGFPKHKSKLKPATEDWWLCTKPGGAKWLGVDACRVGWDAASLARDTARRQSPRTDITGGSFGSASGGQVAGGYVGSTESPAGRWPSNVVLTHGDCNGVCSPDCPVAEMDRQSGESRSNPAKRNRNPRIDTTQYRNGGARYNDTAEYADSGGASRFFPTFAWEADDFAPFLYCSKASRSDRGVGNTHPTVKPLALMRWLVRLITPPGGTVLDPFAGSGTTAVAAIREGFGFVGAESDPAYHAIAERRIAAEAARHPLLEAGRA
jgi:hypothetical protein